MGNYKFRFPSMIPSEWFHKLKNMTKPTKKHPLPSYSLNTTTKKKKSSSESKSLSHSSSSYFSNEPHTSLESNFLQISPRNSHHMIQSKRKTVYKPSPAPSSCFDKSKFNQNQGSSSASRNLKLSSSAEDIIIDMNNRGSKKEIFKEIKVFDSTEKACPASNQTKESRKTHHKTLVSSGRRSSANSPRIKLRASSPRIQLSARRSKSRSPSKQILDSFAVIKSSVDPKKDFKESMVEMIEENHIIATQDLEDLLASYLSLNPKEYHDLIIKVFVQVWLEVINPKSAMK